MVMSASVATVRRMAQVAREGLGSGALEPGEGTSQRSR